MEGGITPCIVNSDNHSTSSSADDQDNICIVTEETLNHTDQHSHKDQSRQFSCKDSIGLPYSKIEQMKTIITYRVGENQNIY